VAIRPGDTAFDADRREFQCQRADDRLQGSVHRGEPRGALDSTPDLVAKVKAMLPCAILCMLSAEFGAAVMTPSGRILSERIMAAKFKIDEIVERENANAPYQEVSSPSHVRPGTEQSI